MSIDAEVAYATMKINKYIESLKKNRKAKKDDKQMKYEFHVGDYVETKDGKIGYITQVIFSNEVNEVKRWCSMRIIHGLNDFIISFEGYEDLIPDKFNRIGQYDFTKKGKIELLTSLDTVSTYCGDGKSNTSSDYKRVLAQDEFNNKKTVDKINEIIEVVNRLEEKVNGN